MRSARKCQEECIEREFARHAPPNSRTKALRHSSAVPVRRSQRFEQHDNNPSSLPLRYCRNSVASSSSTASMALPHGATTSIRAACAYVSTDAPGGAAAAAREGRGNVWLPRARPTSVRKVRETSVYTIRTREGNVNVHAAAHVAMNDERVQSCTLGIPARADPQ